MDKQINRHFNMFCTQILIINQNKYYFTIFTTAIQYVLPLVIILPSHNKQDSGHIDIVHEQFLPAVRLAEGLADDHRKRLPAVHAS